MTSLPVELTATQRERIDALIACVRGLGAQGWTPATSSNFSVRLDDELIAISVSGKDKRQFCSDDVMLADLAGRAVNSQARPSAETRLHTQLYRRFPALGSVLHTHSVTQTLASQLYAPMGRVEFTGYELLKAFDGISSHLDCLRLPIVANSQDMEELAAAVAPLINCGNATHGYLIEGHGLYAWGSDVAEARRHLEAFEFLLECELKKRSLMQ